MRLGILLPSFDIPADPGAIAEFALAAEDLGYDYLTIWEHVIGADLSHRPDWEGRPTLVNFYEPFVTLGYLAGVTKRIEFATSVLILPQRQTVLVAKQAADVDMLSQGRLRLGVGIGWAEAESQALGADWHTRGKRIDEQMSVLRALWTQEVVTFHGRWHHIDEMGLRPLPVQRPIPLWIGAQAGADAALRRVATMADGWIPLLPPDEAPAAIEQMHEFARAAGRDPRSIGVEAVVGARDRAPAEWRRDVESWGTLGATHLLAVTATHAGGSTLPEQLEAMRQFRDAVRDLVHSPVDS